MPQIPVPVIPKLTIGTAIDIAAVAFLIYQFIMIVRGRRAAHILNGLWILLVVYLVALWAGLDLLRSVLAALAPYTAIALIVMFQSDIRRFLSRIGRFRWLGLGGQLERRELADEIILALEQLVGDEGRGADRDGARRRPADVHRKRSGDGCGGVAGSVCARYFIKAARCMTAR